MKNVIHLKIEHKHKKENDAKKGKYLRNWLLLLWQFKAGGLNNNSKLRDVIPKAKANKDRPTIQLSAAIKHKPT